MADSRRRSGYASPGEAILDELRCLDVLIAAHISYLRAAGATSRHLHGLVISDEEIDALISGVGPVALSDTWQAAVRRVRGEIKARKAVSRPTVLRLDRLAALFDLTATDQDVILTALAPELELRYERLYAYLQDDATRKRPTIALALDLLAANAADRLLARQRFAPTAPLRQHHLLEVLDDSTTSDHSRLARPIRLDGRIVDFLLGDDDVDPRLAVKVSRSSRRLEDLPLTNEAEARLNRLINSAKAGENAVAIFRGADEWTAQAAAEATCTILGMPLLVTDVAPSTDVSLPPEVASSLVYREARLQGAGVWIGLGSSPEQTAVRDALIARLGACRVPAFLRGDVNLAQGLPRTTVVDFPVLDLKLRRRFWLRQLNGSALDESDLDGLVNKFSLTGEQIVQVAQLAQDQARWQKSGSLTVDDLYAGCRSVSSHRLGSLARKIVPVYGWEDIILPSEQVNQLAEICARVQYTHVVLDRWGFRDAHSMGGGMTVLFSGPPGTGKTMAAQVIASALRLDLYAIDLSQVVSKYIGETEKNLHQVFAEAQTSNAILLFDEADALFGKRSEVRDAHDRYANIEVGYLLQKMEAYEGIAILATNLRANLDDAFTRRLQVVVEFPFPDEEHRLRIWRRVFPSATPVASDVDFAFLARQLKLAGGSIKNIALAAAYHAAEEGTAIGMRHLLRGACNECQKMGRVLTDSDLAPYARMVHA